jgi:hypothetical protein
MLLDGEFNELVEVVCFIRLHDLLVKTKLGGRQRREFEHNGHEQDKPVRPVLEVLQVSILVPLMARPDVTVHNGHEGKRLKGGEVVSPNPQPPQGERFELFGDNFCDNLGLAAGKRSRTDVRRLRSHLTGAAPTAAVTAASNSTYSEVAKIGSLKRSCCGDSCRSSAASCG